MNPKLPLLVLALGSVVLGAGCTFPSRSTIYDRSRVGRAMHVEVGDVVAVNSVVISGQQGPIGLTGGGIVGHAAATGVGTGTAGALARAGGAVVGAIAGTAIEEVATRREAQEITVKLNSGDTIVIVQEVKDGYFTVGEHVQILQGGAGAVVRRL